MSKESEHSIQARLIKELNYKMRQEIVRFAVPNGGHRHLSVAMKLKAEGVLPGIPDLGFAVEDGRTHWLELKNASGKLSDHQIGIRYKLQKLGHGWAMARTVEDAMDQLAMWGVLK